jgi:RNA polymerase sigma factor (sigma-70 family)
MTHATSSPPPAFPPQRISGLSPAAERRLVAAAGRGDDDARRRLVEAFLPAIGGVARLYRGTPGVGREELMQDGVVGLLRALDRYDPTLGTPFWAYASWWVRQAMQQLVAELSRPIVLSDRALRQLARVKHAERQCGQRSGRQPGVDALVRESGVPRKQIDSLIAADRTAAGLDQPIDDQGRQTLADVVGDPASDDPVESMPLRLVADELPHLLSLLTERERVIVRERFGFDGEEHTLRHLARRLGVSAERVRQVEQVALGKLRDGLAAAPS